MSIMPNLGAKRVNPLEICPSSAARMFRPAMFNQRYMHSGSTCGILHTLTTGRGASEAHELQELMKFPDKKHRVSPVPGNLNVADIGNDMPKARPKS